MSSRSTPLDLAGSNSGLAGMHNLGVVLEAIHRNGPISRTELASRSGLSKQGVARIAERLMDRGLVIEARRRRGGRGQPAIDLEINPEGCFAIGICLDRDFLTLVTVDAVGRVRARMHLEERYILPDAFLTFCAEGLADLRRRRVFPEDRLVGIGIAIPDWLGEIPFIGMPAAYAQWSTVDLRATFARFTDLPVYIDNDATSAALGELTYGLGREFQTFFYVAIGAGLGGGLVIDHVCHSGTSGLSGEVGWLPTAIPQVPEGQHRKPLGQFVLLFSLYDRLAAAGYAVSEPQRLLTLDEGGRAIVSQWLQNVAHYIAEAAIDIGLIIDPDAVLLGGRLPVRLLDELLRHLQGVLARDDRPSPPVYRAAAQDAGALGAATMPLADTLNLASPRAVQRTRSPLPLRPMVA